MATPIVMPKLGNSVESSIIVRWHKNVGDAVVVGDAICEVETDKASVDVESPAAGTLLARFFDVGDDVPVMVNIAALGVVGEHVDGLRPDNAPKKQGIVQNKTKDAIYGVPTNNPQTPAKGGLPSVVLSQMSSQSISPRARNLAKREGVTIEKIQGSGPGGRIIERDVRAMMTRAPKMTPLAKAMVASGDFASPEGASGRITSKDLQPVQPDDDRVEAIPLKGVRKVIATRMLQSLQTTAQLTLNTSADARALQAYRKRLKASDESLGLRKVTINDLVMFAVSRTLVSFPELNSLFYDETIYRHRDVQLGFAVDTPRGLIVPVIRRAHTLSLKALADEAWRLARACQDGNVKPNELEGGTFTVSNLGSFGIESFTPVLNPPQVAILGVGSINLKAVDVDGEVVFVPHIGLSLTINHQVVDGAPGARFLQQLAKNLTEIETLLAL
jgi:pyruvate dehydrogenase E2 component (dihydrolipoamide acetyltransferase)